MIEIFGSETKGNQTTGLRLILIFTSMNLHNLEVR